MPSPHILLTGGTGLIGSRWLTRLLAEDPELRVTVLARDPRCVPRHRRVEAVRADLAAPELPVVPSVTEIIHCAADIRFGLPLAEARRINTGGTAALLELARRTSGLERFTHVSTTYVQGRDSGSLPEARYENRSGFLNSYQQSKYEAEELVFDAMREVPATVFRLSSVIGDSATGHVSQQNYFHQALRLIPQCPIPFLPADRDCRVDLIPDDWAVEALMKLYSGGPQPGSVHNICAGRTATPVGTLLEAVFERYDTACRPKAVSLEEFESYAVSILNNGARPALKAMVEAILRFIPHLAIDQTFDNKRLRDAGVSLPDPAFVHRVLDHCTPTTARDSVFG